MAVPLRPVVLQSERERERFHRTKLSWILEFSLYGPFLRWKPASYHIISYHHHIISYHIISYHHHHIISYHIISYHIIIISYHIISLSSLLYENNVNIWYMMIIIFHYHLSMSLPLVFLCLLLSISPHYLSIHLSIHLPIYLSSPPAPVWFFCASGRNLSESSWFNQFNPILIFDTPYPLVN